MTTDHKNRYTYFSLPNQDRKSRPIIPGLVSAHKKWLRVPRTPVTKGGFLVVIDTIVALCALRPEARK